MTPSDPYPSGVDPAHVLAIATMAASDGQHDGAVLLTSGRRAARVYLPTRAGAQAAHTALQRVGYQISRTGNRRGRDVIVTGWSAEGLESRLIVMRTAQVRLAAEPLATALVALDAFADLPATELPGQAGQQQLVRQATQRLRAWIARTSGIHAPCDPGSRPADLGCALRLNATREAEKVIDNLAARQVRVAELAVALYPDLRRQMSHDHACDSAVRRAGLAFHLSPPLAQDTTTLLHGTDPAPGPAPKPASLPGASPRDHPPIMPRPRPRPRTARESPFSGMPISPTSRPPSTRGATRPRGRNFPSGRPGPHR